MNKNNIPKIIWQCWFQGFSSEVPFVNYNCINQWREINSEYQHILLTNENIDDYIPEYNSILSQTNFQRSFAAKSDLVRILILCKYGGTWADASVFPLRKLDSILDTTCKDYDFFGFKFKSPILDSARGSRIIASWFLTSSPNHPIVEKWKEDYTKRFIENENYRYYEFHDAFTTLAQSNNPCINELTKMSTHYTGIPFSQTKLPPWERNNWEAKIKRSKNPSKLQRQWMMLKRPDIRMLPLLLNDINIYRNARKFDHFYRKNEEYFEFYSAIARRLGSTNKRVTAQTWSAGVNTESLIEITKEIGKFLKE